MPCRITSWLLLRHTSTTYYLVTSWRELAFYMFQILKKWEIVTYNCYNDIKDMKGMSLSVTLPWRCFAIRHFSVFSFFFLIWSSNILHTKNKGHMIFECFIGLEFWWNKCWNEWTLLNAVMFDSILDRLPVSSFKPSTLFSVSRFCYFIHTVNSSLVQVF